MLQIQSNIIESKATRAKRKRMLALSIFESTDVKNIEASETQDDLRCHTNSGTHIQEINCRFDDINDRMEIENALDTIYLVLYYSIASTLCRVLYFRRRYSISSLFSHSIVFYFSVDRRIVLVCFLSICCFIITSINTTTSMLIFIFYLCHINYFWFSILSGRFDGI